MSPGRGARRHVLPCGRDGVPLGWLATDTPPTGENFPSSSSSQPSIVADMLAALAPQPGERVLEIGTGTGWNAALLRHRVGPAGHVTTIEVDPGLAETARSPRPTSPPRW